MWGQNIFHGLSTNESAALFHILMFFTYANITIKFYYTMKICEFRGGLGNQLFEYAHYLYMKKKYPDEKFYGYYPSRELWCHQGLEIHKRFDVCLPKSSKITDLIGWILFTCNRKEYLSPFVKMLGVVSDDTNVKEYALLQEGYWQDRKYFANDFRFEYRCDGLNQRTKDFCKELKSLSYTIVSVHIRRGDYLTCDCPQDFAGICTPKYYENAFQYISSNIEKPLFVFFSDDSNFVREEFHLPNMIVVDWNKGEDSWQDMFLMSQCKAMILANSTFSFWAAQNNKNKPVVLCPTKWNNLLNPQITMPGWIEVPSV